MTLAKSPLRYSGVIAKNPPDLLRTARAPTTSDKSFRFGTIWIDTATDDVYELTSVSGGSANWTLLGSSSSGILDVPHGGTGRATLTNHGVLVGAGTSAITQLSVGATGTVLAGSTGADPAFTATPSVTTLTATTINGTTVTTNVAAAQLSLNGTTLSATGSDSNVSLNLATKGTGSIVSSRSSAGVDLNMQITNSDNTAASSPAGIQLAVGGSTNTGDPYVQYSVSGAQTWTTGIDNSASDAYVIAASNALGTTNAASWSTAGALTNTAAITATAGDITASNGNLVTVTAASGLVLPVTTASGAAASPLVCNGRVGAATFTSVSIAAAADLTLTITNSAITGSSTVVHYSLSGTTTGSAVSIKSVTNSAGSSAVVITNGTGATTTTADLTLTFLVLN